MKVLRFLDEKLEEYLMVALIMFMTALIFVQVVMRYVFGNSLGWSEELARYVFLWSIWLGASYGAKVRGHIRLTIITGKLKGKAKIALEAVVYVIWLAFIVFLVIKGFDLVGQIMSAHQTSTALHLPMWIAYASVPVGCTLMTIRMIQTGIQDFKAIKAGTFGQQPTQEEKEMQETLEEYGKGDEE